MAKSLRALKWLSIGLATVALGGVVYGWGQGLFNPCGTLDRYLRLSNCAIIAHWGGDQEVEALAAASDGALLAVLGSSLETPVASQQLIEVQQDGTLRSVTPLEVAPDQRWSMASLSPDGATILARFYNASAALFDRVSGKQLASYDETYGGREAGFASNGDVLISTVLGSLDQPFSPTALRFAPDGTGKRAVSGAEIVPINWTGTGLALSPDGELLVQHEKTLRQTGVVALRVIEPQFASRAGSLMIAPISGWMDQILPRIWISPDSRYVAASFDSADEWGKINSALAVWDIESKRLLSLTPTWRARWDNVAWLPDGRLAASRHNIDWHDTDIALITYARFDE